MSAREPHYLSVLPSAVLVVGAEGTVEYINPAAEDLLGISVSQAKTRNIAELPGFDEHLRSLISRVFSSGEEVKLYDHLLTLPQQNGISVVLGIAPLIFAEENIQSEMVEQVLVSITRTGGSKRLNASAWKQEATRAAGIMAAMLAHEVKNPLSGIKGAAQLLGEEVSPENKALTDLICLETDRIRDLLNQVEIFSDEAPMERSAVNIHEVLQYVISVAGAGFAPNLNFKEVYDPSLPMVAAHRDSLVQLFLNLIKNAAEAMAGQENAKLKLTTQYKSGYRRPQEAKGEARGDGVMLPVQVCIEDNGPGIPADIRPYIFEPLVSSKSDGRGLGLAVVAKLAADMGAVVELDDSRENGTRFLVMLPVFNGK